MIIKYFNSEKKLAIKNIASFLPPLPKVVRYYDEFDDKVRSIVNIENNNKIEIYSNGVKRLIKLEKYEDYISFTIKSILVFILSDNISPQTAIRYIDGFGSIETIYIEKILICDPKDIAILWNEFRSENYLISSYLCVKILLRMLSEYRISGWSIDYIHLIKSLPLPATDKYAGVCSGDVFLSIEEEAFIVRHLDEIVSSINVLPTPIDFSDLVDALLLLCAYQFGMRPLQIASVRISDVQVWNDDVTSPSIHLTFPMIKQRRASTSRPLTRKIKREWAVLAYTLYAMHRENNASGEDRFFDIHSGQEAGKRISILLNKLIPGGATATDLRHTAAQRLVDAGANQEELAEFLGHSDITTGLVYYVSSANQTERVNKALGISEIYSKVARIARNKFISFDELSKLKDDQQIAGVPHGIPIAGIGGCSSGQPLCPSNPILACYGCHKFMPIHEISIHEQVLIDFRSIVQIFYTSSRDSQNSPAYLQLQNTISSVLMIIDELKMSSINE